jgi:hypothetical protein
MMKVNRPHGAKRLVALSHVARNDQKKWRELAMSDNAFVKFDGAKRPWRELSAYLRLLCRVPLLSAFFY